MPAIQELLRLDEPIALRVISSSTDGEGVEHVRLQQVLDGIPVRGGALTVSRDASEQLSWLGRGPMWIDLDCRPVLNASEALHLAGPLVDPVAELIVDAWHGKPRLVWEVRAAVALVAGQASAPVVRIDDRSGEILAVREGLRSDRSRPTTTGSWWMPATGHHVGDVHVPVWFDAAGSRAVFEDVAHSFATLSYPSSGAVRRVDATPPDPMVVDAQFGAAATLAYLSAEHGLDGLDGLGGPTFLPSEGGGVGVLPINVHYGTGNAYWDDGVWLGDGGSSDRDQFASVDVVAHELGHGVTEYSANLIYEDESGALNESWSDVFGAVVQRRVEGESPRIWLVGEDVVTPGVSGDALRYMFDPTRDGYSRDHYDSRYTGWDDSGGVHWNSGIGNLAFFLVAEGGTHPTRGGPAVRGIGVDRAMRIWLHALRYELTESASFGDARAALERSAALLEGEGGRAHRAVRDAWVAVGVASSAIDCSGQAALRGQLATGGTWFAPSEFGFLSPGGLVEATLIGPVSGDFDLYLQQDLGGAWVSVASSATASWQERVSYTAAPGTYRWSVLAWSGAGDFELCGTH